MKLTLKYLKPYRNKAVAGLVFKLLSALMELTIPLIMAHMVNLAATESTQTILFWCGVIFAEVVINLCFDLICQYYASYSSAGIGQGLRTALFQKVNSFSDAEIDRFGASSLITRTTSDVTQIQQAVAMGIRLLSRAPFMAVGAMVMAMGLNLRLSLIFAAVIVLVLLCTNFIRAKTVPMYSSVQSKLDNVTGETKEELEGMRVLRAFNMEGIKRDQFDAVAKDYQKAVMDVNRIAALLSPVTFLIINMAIVAVVWFGGRMVGLGEMPAGNIMALTSYLMQVLLAMNVISNLIVIFTKAGASAKRVEQVLHTENGLREVPNACAEPMQNPELLRFENVTFTYEGASKPSLREISFAVRRGECIGIIGGTGQGKTTLINLISRNYDVDSGKILVDGCDVRQWKLSALREFVGIAPQKAALLSLSVRENICMGRPNASEDQLRHAAQMAEAEEFILEMDGQYEHAVEQEGRNLSGGQKQRISLARMFLKRPELLLLDDSLSALDFLTENRVRTHMREELADKTVLLVSQRVSTLRHCDRILVMENGRISAQGTHEELMERSRLYREIAESQLG